MKNKIRTLFVILLLVGLLTACELGSQPTEVDEPDTVEQEPAPVPTTEEQPAAPDAGETGGEEAGSEETESSESSPPEVVSVGAEPGESNYVIVDTGQSECFDNTAAAACPGEAQAFYGQDAQYVGIQPNLIDNGDGTITDSNTGLVWTKDPGEVLTYQEAVAKTGTLDTGGFTDWRLPTIKELYSLVQFSGSSPYIDANRFVLPSSEAKFTSSTRVVEEGGFFADQAYAVNFTTGQIVAYDLQNNGNPALFYAFYVRGNTVYGINNFVDHEDGTVSDLSTGLMWTKADSGSGAPWEGALNYCENLSYAGYDDWYLPNAKELQSIVDYAYSPDASLTAAIDPVFTTSPLQNEAGETDYPYFWSSTTHVNALGAQNAVYLAFGSAMNFVNGVWLDVDAAGAQRSDPKAGDPASFPNGLGELGAAVRINNFVRCVRVDAEISPEQFDEALQSLPAVTPTLMPGQTGGGPTEEAKASCENKSVGAGCSFELPHGTVYGTCREIGILIACIANPLDIDIPDTIPTLPALPWP